MPKLPSCTCGSCRTCIRNAQWVAHRNARLSRLAYSRCLAVACMSFHPPKPEVLSYAKS